MKNITQITNFDLASVSTVSKVIHKGGEGTRVSKPYKIVPQSYIPHSIIKLGYCVESKGIDLPIFLTVNGTEKEFQIGKTGMYEFQPETWKNINDDDSEEQTIEVEVTGIAVPANIVFTLDYCYYTN